MRLTFLGTGAAEGYPAIWCRCERCTTARARGGRNLRLRSAALVNDDLLLDVGPDVVAAAVARGLDLAPVQALLVTHPHSDHLDPTVLMWRRRGFVTTGLPPLHLYGSARTLERVGRPEGREQPLEDLRIVGHPFRPFERFRIRTGSAAPPEPDPRFPDGPRPVPRTPERCYEVWTLAANHAAPEDEACVFVIRQTEGPGSEPTDPTDGNGIPALLYATDTGPFPPETWAALERLGAEEGLRLHCAAIDSTLGDGPDGSSHMSVHQMADHQDGLARRGLLAPGARRLGHHFSHGRTPPYEELCVLLAPRGVEVAYDGLTLTI